MKHRDRLLLQIACVTVVTLLSTRTTMGQYARYPTLSGQIQPIQDTRLPTWMTLDVSLRTRTEFQSSINFKSGDSPLYDLTRVRAGIRFHPVPWFNAYVQIHDAHALALSPTDISPTMRDTFDLRQALISFKRKKTQFIVGRQPLRFADERLVGISDWTNVSRTFDAIMLTTDGKNRVSIFTSSVVDIYPGRPDRTVGGLHFHGAVLALESVVPRTSLQPFLFVKTNSGVTSSLQKDGRQNSFTFGVFAAGDLPAGFFYSGTGALQRGDYARQSVQAGGGIVRFGYTARKLPLAPEVSVEYDYATGDNGRDRNRRSTFDQLYPSNHAVFGLTDLFGWQNIKERKAGATIVPHKDLSVSVAVESLHLATNRDAVYGGSGTTLLLPSTGTFHADDIGTEIDFSAKYVIHDFVTNIGVGHFFPGAVMTEGNKGSPLTLAYLSFTYRFSLQHDHKNQQKKPAETEHHLPQKESDD
jgi:hypothetical protein